MRLLLLVFLLPACGPAFYTDSGRVGVELANVVDPGTDGAPSPFLAGTRTQASLSCAGDCPDGVKDVTDCFTQSVEGPAQIDGGGLLFQSAGDVTWRFAAEPCPATDLGWTPEDDAVTVTVLDAADVTGHLPHLYEQYADEFVAQGTLRLDAPEGWLPADGEPTRIVAGRDVGVFPRLRDADGTAVAWSLEGAVVSALPVNGELPAVALSADVAAVHIGAGDVAGLSLDLPGPDAAFPLGEVEGVDAADVTALDVAVAYMVGEDGSETPGFLRAVAWDADGNPVFGLPVTWSLDREMALSSAGDTFPDYASLGDACVAPSEDYGPQTATLTVRWGDLSATKTLAWTPRTEPGDDTDWEVDPSCTTSLAGAPIAAEEGGGGTCGCGTGSAPGMFPALLALLALRRRTPV